MSEPHLERQPVGEHSGPARTRWLTVATWHSRVSYLLATGGLLFVFVACLLTRNWIPAAVCVPFLIGFIAAGPGRLRGDMFRRSRGRSEPLPPSSG